VAESGTGNVCPYRGGKGLVSTPVDLSLDLDPREEMSRAC